MSARGVPGRVTGGAAGEEQRAESREAPAGSSARSRAASRVAGWHWLVLLRRASPRSPGSLPLHIQNQVGKESSTYLVCATLSLLSRALQRGRSLRRCPPSPPGDGPTWGAGSCGMGPCGGPCATSAPSNQPQALAMETSLIFNNIRTAKIPLRLCGQCQRTLRHGGGHSSAPVPPWPHQDPALPRLPLLPVPRAGQHTYRSLNRINTVKKTVKSSIERQKERQQQVRGSNQTPRGLWISY